MHLETTNWLLIDVLPHKLDIIILHMQLSLYEIRVHVH